MSASASLSFSVAGPTASDKLPASYSQFTPPRQTRHRQDRLVASGGQCELGIRNPALAEFISRRVQALL